MRKGSGGAGVDRRGAEHTAQTIHHRLTTTIPIQGPDYTGERTERIRTSFIPGTVRDLPSYHSPTQCSLSPVVRRLYPRIVQKTQQVPTVILPAKLVLQPHVIAVRHRTVSEMMAYLSSQPLLLPSIVHHLSSDVVTPTAPSPL